MAVTPSPLGTALDTAVDAVMDLCRCCTAGLPGGPWPLSPELADLQDHLDGTNLAALAPAPAGPLAPRDVVGRIDADIATALTALARATATGAIAGGVL